MRKILIVIDMQRDFIDGALGTAEARAVVPAVIEKIKGYAPEDVFATRDTHGEDYLNTQEGRYLPVKHCIRGTAGWELDAEIAALIPKDHIFDKGTFASTELAAAVKELAARESVELELIGICTDICVVSNALLLKALLPEVKISVDSACCAGVTPEKHAAALETLRSCQIQCS